ncbi:hypothetical protein SAMN05661008_01864 [Alkalithermobacter thermoalcaliphilus JW-YL-7 = DSM 7308]|uniref:Uncharacterized protein n=1 Tax=Alkalithermobacter thermoalcaliphilus JW-YL-7 = DSM 7308 TaxID=1121328 RepID=A0A150FMP8_CLOPD|nr:hypothetical protein JWYL7_1941 [[Clostridium] paradoxum JW-YL-7 = DSM 7308]SHL31588.1 hypothetical protein SAMN05661008_01864 [[Clostridium] paradoxum JW-YL-7 = DSM 7308]
MILNWICFISILALIGQVMMYLYMSAIADMNKTKVKKKVTRPSYQEQYTYQKIAK